MVLCILVLLFLYSAIRMLHQSSINLTCINS
uniref:Uncharacterized protein n=1 Tax=Arundo donax TaxID=35708 RepID=A0A0A9BBS2_ARUDO